MAVVVEKMKTLILGTDRGEKADGGTWQTNFVYDNLNRMTEAPMGNGILEYDALGRRTWCSREAYIGGKRYDWDVMGRATAILGDSAGNAFKYRADGMRTEKIDGLTLAWQWDDEENKSGHYDENTATNRATTRYYYDGQMPCEEDYTVAGEESTPTTVTCYGLGARGVDVMFDPANVGISAKQYPLYDGHGNSIGVVSRTSSSPYHSLSGQKSYDVWGGVRSGSGGNAGRYCANLGHKQDDESGLIYMRARCYEPETGRFISQDPGMHGSNWYSYCRNNPVNHIDKAGRDVTFEGFGGLLLTGIGYTLIMTAGVIAANSWTPETAGLAFGASIVGIACLAAAFAFSDNDASTKLQVAAIALGIELALSICATQIAFQVAEVALAGKSIARAAVILTFVYGQMIWSMLVGLDLDISTLMMPSGTF